MTPELEVCNTDDPGTVAHDTDELSSGAAEATAKLVLLSVVIPARDEEACIRATVEHLHLELDLQNIAHEIVVVDDGSTDRTWDIVRETK
ncbi:MAG: glycosyltransferase, partial [Planctomycetes bacterium]|nr:glycosyltransferase [Planctomycetota bacterium]